jgi:hypothetical protein
MEEASNNSSDATVDIPCTLQASSANICLSKVEEYLWSLTCPQNLSGADFYQFMQYSSGFSISNSKLWCHDTHRRDGIVVPKEKRYKLSKVHDILEHKKIHAISIQLLEQFWWLFLDQDVKWFVQTCHQCQVHQMCYHHILPIVATCDSLFRKAHVDTMYMPHASRYHHIIQACCLLLSYPEHQKLRKENRSTIGVFIFDEILCHWGALEEIVTDSSPAFIEALNWLAEQYGIHHIHISLIQHI